MNDIESLAKEAGITAVKSLLFRREQGQEMTWPEQQEWDSVVSFAKRVAEAEREACAKICEAEGSRNDGITCAELIRDRK